MVDTQTSAGPSDGLQPECAPARIGVVTVSDRASALVYADRGGPAIVDFLTRVLTSPHVLVRKLIPDEQPVVEATLCELADELGCCLVVTTGGTGPARRDITPEATLAVCEREMPGFGEQMRAASLKSVPTAILSRQVAGTRGGCLIINLPGKPAAIEECLLAIFAAVPYCIDLMGGPKLETDAALVKAFRPGK